MIKAVDKRLIVKKIEEEPEKGKLIIQVSQNMPFKATVVAVGGNVDTRVDNGDIVILAPNVGTPIEIEGVKYLAIYEDQILAVIGK